jgi:hypothetical protein
MNLPNLSSADAAGYIDDPFARTTNRDEQDKRGAILVYPSLNYINPFNPRPEDIDIRDIAHALALTSRYGGHSPEPYSVAEHSWRVSCLMQNRTYYNEPTLLLAALLHDAEEAYFGDMPSPIKHNPEMASFRIASCAMSRAIFAKFGIDHSLIAHTKWADDAEYHRERRAMWPDDPKDYVKPWPWQQAELWFLNRFEILQAERAAKVAT